MATRNRVVPLAALQQQVARQQLVALRSWLGDDHELVTQAGLAAGSKAAGTAAAPSPAAPARPAVESASLGKAASRTQA